MKIEIAGTVARLVAEVFCPISGIADLGALAQDHPAIGGEGLQCRDSRIGAGGRAGGGPSAQFGADQEAVDTDRRRIELGIMQDQPAIA